MSKLSTKRTFLYFSALLFSSATAFGMPCDISATQVSCVSASGQYSFTTLTCGYDQNLSGAELKIKSEPKAAGEVSQQWFGQAFYGVEFNLSDQSGDHQRYVSFEWSAATEKGTVTDKQRDFDPAPWSSKSEPINCKVMDVTGQ